jgi:hypothetical protein
MGSQGMSLGRELSFAYAEPGDLWQHQTHHSKQYLEGRKSYQKLGMEAMWSWAWQEIEGNLRDRVDLSKALKWVILAFFDPTIMSAILIFIYPQCENNELNWNPNKNLILPRTICCREDCATIATNITSTFLRRAQGRPTEADFRSKFIQEKIGLSWWQSCESELINSP